MSKADKLRAKAFIRQQERINMATAKEIAAGIISGCLSKNKPLPGLTHYRFL
jgi:hypothetical protein